MIKEFYKNGNLKQIIYMKGDHKHPFKKRLWLENGKELVPANKFKIRQDSDIIYEDGKGTRIILGQDQIERFLTSGIIK